MKITLGRLLLISTAALAGCESSLNIDVVVPAYAPDTEVRLNLEGVALQPTGNGAAVEIIRSADLNLRVLDDRSAVPTTLISGAAPADGEYRGLRLLFDDIEGAVIDLDALPPARGGDIDRADDADPADDMLAAVAFLFEEDEGDDRSLILALDLGLSLSRPEGSDDYVLDPVVRAMEAGDQARVSGTVLATLLTDADCADGGVAIYAYAGADISPVERSSSGVVQPIATAAVDRSLASATYVLDYLAPGTYTLALTCDAEDDNGVEAADDSLEFFGSTTVELEPAERLVLNFVSA